MKIPRRFPSPQLRDLPTKQVKGREEEEEFERGRTSLSEFGCDYWRSMSVKTST